MKKLPWQTIVAIGGASFVSQAAWASAYNETMSVMMMVVNMIFAVCMIAGIMFIGIAAVKYQQHRQNPSETPLSRVLYALFFGIAMVVLPYIASKANIHSEMETAADQEQPS